MEGFLYISQNARAFPENERITATPAGKSADALHLLLRIRENIFFLQAKRMGYYSGGQKVAYVKRFIEKASAEVSEKKKAETAGKTRLNQPSGTSVCNSEPNVNK